MKLWPNLVFLRDGQVVKQLARPEVEEVREGLDVDRRRGMSVGENRSRNGTGLRSFSSLRFR